MSISIYCRCVVWTGDGRVFFYNPSSRTSVWERPDILTGRADVDKAVASPPPVVQPATSVSGKLSEASKLTLKRDQTDADNTESPLIKKLKKDGNYFNILFSVYQISLNSNFFKTILFC